MFNCNHLSEYLGNSLIVTLFYTQCESRVKNIRIQQHKTSSSNISVDQHVILCSHLLRSLWEDFFVIQYISHLPKNEELCAYNFNLYSWEFGSVDNNVISIIGHSCPLPALILFLNLLNNFFNKRGSSKKALQVVKTSWNVYQFLVSSQDIEDSTDERLHNWNLHLTQMLIL